jgi:hypothetical protein
VHWRGQSKHHTIFRLRKWACTVHFVHFTYFFIIFLLFSAKNYRLLCTWFRDGQIAGLANACSLDAYALYIAHKVRIIKYVACTDIHVDRLPKTLPPGITIQSLSEVPDEAILAYDRKCDATEEQKYEIKFTTALLCESVLPGVRRERYIKAVLGQPESTTMVWFVNRNYFYTLTILCRPCFRWRRLWNVPNSTCSGAATECHSLLRWHTGMFCCWSVKNFDTRKINSQTYTCWSR